VPSGIRRSETGRSTPIGSSGISPQSNMATINPISRYVHAISRIRQRRPEATPLTSGGTCTPRSWTQPLMEARKPLGFQRHPGNVQQSGIRPTAVRNVVIFIALYVPRL
jgi:hypothetical protein